MPDASTFTGLPAANMPTGIAQAASYVAPRKVQPGTQTKAAAATAAGTPVLRHAVAKSILDIANARRVPSKQANETLLLSGNKDLLKLFYWMCVYSARSRQKIVLHNREFSNSTPSLAI